jgi:hypothetical protein
LTDVGARGPADLVDDLPDKDEMVADLQKMIRLYETGLDVRKNLLVTRPGGLEIPAPPS